MMRALRVIAWCMALLLVCIESVSAQFDRLPSRSELDSLANPTLSTIAGRGVAAERSTIYIEDIDNTEPIKEVFTLRNTTSSTVAITQLRSMCSCLKVLTRPKALRPGEKLNIEVEFNPAGRTREFNIMVFVYTSLDTKYPTERLTLSGTIRSTK